MPAIRPRMQRAKEVDMEIRMKREGEDMVDMVEFNRRGESCQL
jgi:hypothetical protein